MRLTVELLDRTFVTVLLVKDFRTAREFKPFDFVRMRSLYLPDLTNGNTKALE